LMCLQIAAIIDISTMRYDMKNKLTEAEELHIQQLVKSFNKFYGIDTDKSDVVYKTESEMYEEYCDENDLL